MSKQILLLVFLFSFSVSLSAQEEPKKVPLSIQYKTIESNATKLINDWTYEVDSVSVSNDGTKVCWVGKGLDIKALPRNSVYHMDLANDPGTLWKVPKQTPLDAHVRCSYDTNDNLLLSELTYRFGALTRTFLYMRRTGEYEPYGFNSNFSIYNEYGYRIERIRPVHLGHKRNTLYIKHPKVSPDGKWIVYYTHEDKTERGIYLLHRATGNVHKVTELYDKHPIWSPDGKRIFFHHQKDVEGREQAYLGYYEVEHLSPEKIVTKRVMLDDPEMPGYIYHKHPAIYPKGNIVYFHGQLKPDGKKHLFARKIIPGSQVFRIKLKLGDVKFKKAKHPHASKVDDGLFFIGKTKEDEKYKVYKFEYEGAALVEEAIHDDQ